MHRWICMSLIGLLLAGVGSAQAAPRGREHEGPGPGPERREKLEALRLMKMTEALDLSESEAAKLFPLLNSLKKEREALRDREIEAVENLEKALEAGGDGQAERLEKGLAALSEIRAKQAARPQDELERVRGALSLEKVARFAVFQVRFESKMRELLRDGPPPPPPPPDGEPR